MLRIAAALILLSAGPAMAQSAEPPKAADPDIVVEGQVEKEKRVVCQRQVSTGSIMTRRTCKTQAQIETDREKSLATLGRLRQDQEDRRNAACMIAAVKPGQPGC